MIKLTRLGGREFVVNADLIETIEATPDTVLTLTSGHRYIVQESPEEVAESAREFLRYIHGQVPAASEE